jgi:glucose/arabinose dehydrogenase
MGRWLSAAVLTFLLFACEAPDPAPERTAPPNDSPVASSPEEQRAPDPRRARIALRPVADGLDAPLGLVDAGDGSGRLFIVEQPGTIRILEDGRVAEDPFLDISDRITSGGEQGLLGLAFDPDYASNRRFFVNYTDNAGDTVVARFEAAGEGDVADPSTERVLLRIEQPYSNHNGGHLAFGPDGYLYIATGDGGAGGDPHENGQALDTLLGKLLRLDVSGDDAAAPEDNPFVEREGARPEIWAYGLRNPWRFSFDRERIWVADVGQSAREEVNVQPADEGGLNYGWNIMEGSECFGAPDCDREGLVLPVAEYGHGDGCSITGGHVYRGSAVPDLRGGYVFGDFCSGTVWILDSSDPERDAAVALRTGLSIASFGVDAESELYVVDLNGSIHRIVEG